MLRATPHLPSSPPIKSQNASFSVAALLVQRCRGGGAAFAFSALGDGRYDGNPRGLCPVLKYLL